MSTPNQSRIHSVEIGDLEEMHQDEPRLRAAGWRCVLLACLVVVLAFEPPASRAELAPSVAVAAAVAVSSSAPLVRRAEARRVASARAVPDVDSAPVVAPAAAPRERPRAVRRLYVEHCCLLC